MYKHVLASVHGSETSRLGLAEAVKLAGALEAQIRLAHVVNRLPWVFPHSTVPLLMVRGSGVART
jgi:nucleotide-binding universal stress UspA family protein